MANLTSHQKFLTIIRIALDSISNGILEVQGVPDLPLCESLLAPMAELKIDPQQLGKYNGNNQHLPICVGIKGIVFDVTARRDLYGQGGMYAVFAGKEVARALALGSTKEADCVGDTTGLSEGAISNLESWLTYFEKKYPVIARLEQRDA